MADGPSLETYTNHANSTANAPANGAPPVNGDATLGRTLLFAGIAVASAALAFAIVRATLRRAPSDPTTERIQQLIDEANRLLKQLDEKKPE